MDSQAEIIVKSIAMPNKDPHINEPLKPNLTKIWIGVAIVTMGALGYWKFGHLLSIDSLASKESGLREYQLNHPAPVLGLSFLIYVVATGLSLPGAALLTLFLGWFLGFGKGLLLVSFASTAGATMAFLLSRFLLNDVIQSKFGDRLEKFNEALKKEGAFYLFTLRLIPAVPFFVINLVMGLTPIPTRTFWWVSQVGMLPGTIVFVYAGSQFPSLSVLAEKGASGILTPQLFIAFILLGIFPIMVKKIMNQLKTKINPS